MPCEPESLALRDRDGVKPAEVMMDRRDLHHRLTRARRVLVIPAQSPISPQPGEGPFHHPAALQRHELPLAGLAADDHHGVVRTFGIALALVNAKGGVLLVDEVENGIHYSVLPDLWRLTFDVAARLDVQVFATSHSWDCIEAFQKAAEENKVEEGVLVRIDRKDDTTRAVLYDEREVGIAVEGRIEVR
jgi:hypothetical protein